MFRKSKIEPVEKVKIVERYLAGEIGIRQAGKELGVDHHSIRNWISIYQYDGPTGLLNQPKNRSYLKDLKISAINDYLNGEGSLQDICTKYGIRSHRQLSDWIKVYNSGGRALKYDCSYQQVRNWVIRYEKMGQAGLETDVDVVYLLFQAEHLKNILAEGKRILSNTEGTAGHAGTVAAVTA